MNLRGTWTLFRKEVRRFMVVAMQTLLAPVITALLYLVIFSHVMADRVTMYDDLAYSSFLVPGLIMMSIIQNAFANSSSSLVFSKVTGSIVFVLLGPLTHLEFCLAFVAAAMVRALLVGLAIFVAASLYLEVQVAAPLYVLLFGFFGAATLATTGFIVGIWADKFDHAATFQNFVIMPLSFLSGVFYSIHSLPGVWQQISKFNPLFYMIDGFRYGFFGQSDVDPQIGIAVMCGALAMLGIISLTILRSGYKLRT
ncbi:MAG: ABC transporter permease [Gammaproteobacteria bacterium]